MGTAAPTTSSGRWLSLQITKYPLGAMEPAERPDPGQPKNDFFFQMEQRRAEICRQESRGSWAGFHQEHGRGAA